MTIGENIKKFREENGWTEREFADRMGVTRQAVVLWENQKRIPSAYYIPQMIKVFQIRYEDLFRGL